MDKLLLTNISLLLFIVACQDLNMTTTNADVLTSHVQMRENEQFKPDQIGSKGTLGFEIRDGDSGNLMPGKLVFLQHGEAIELGVESSGAMASRKNTIYTALGIDTVRISAGTYEVWAGRGMEYSADVHDITIFADSTTILRATIKRVIDTKGYVSGDMHLHTLTHSGHGDANLDERIISCLGEGLEWAVATDHNHLTDYAPTKSALGTTEALATTIGNEISTSSYHINAYPLAGKLEAMNRARTHTDSLFKLLRMEFPGAVIQINHPRSVSSAFFTAKKLDPFWGAFHSTGTIPEFDAVEIVNGNSALGWTAERSSPHSVRQDWYNLLNAGHRFTAVGNSDSHSVLRILAGTPRNYIASSTDDPAQISESELAENIKSHSVSVSRGLFLELSVGDSAGIGDQIMARDGRLDLDIRVQAAPWVDCDSVLIVRNGRVVKTFAVKNTTRVERFRRTVTLRPERDAWYIVIAKGTESMAPLVHDGDVPVTPLAFTNPIWVDADGDSAFTCLRDDANHLYRQHKNTPEKLAGMLITDPEMMCFVIEKLSDEKAQLQLDFYKRYLPKASMHTRLLIYRQLALLDNRESAEVLSETANRAIHPLEIISIERALEKIRKALKQKTGEHLTIDDLNYLYSVFLNYQTGTMQREWRLLADANRLASRAKAAVSSRIEDALKQDSVIHAADLDKWQKYQPAENGIVDLDQILGKEKSNRAGVVSKFYSQYSGEMKFFISSPNKLKISINEQIAFQKEASQQKNFADKIIAMPVKKGENSMRIDIERGASNFRYALEPIDSNGWLNPEIANKKIRRHLAFGKEVELRYPYIAYRSGGEGALTDGILASADRNDGFWRGFEKNDLEAVIDLGEVRTISRISTGYLQVSSVMIMLPKAVEYAVSTNGFFYQHLATLRHEVSPKDQTHAIHDFVVEVDSVQARYIRVRAENIISVPDLYPTSGDDFPAWLFVDEIIIE